MAITISLSPDIEAKLYAKAEQQGQDINTLAAELLTQLLQWEQQDTEEAISGIQQGLDDFAAGRSRSFQDFALEQRQKYDLPTDTGTTVEGEMLIEFSSQFWKPMMH